MKGTMKDAVTIIVGPVPFWTLTTMAFFHL